MDKIAYLNDINDLIEELLQMLLGYGFFGGFILATILSIVSFGIFQAFSLPNINK